MQKLTMLQTCALKAKPLYDQIYTNILIIHYINRKADLKINNRMIRPTSLHTRNFVLWQQLFKLA